MSLTEATQSETLKWLRIIALLALSAISAPVLAEADGPDFYDVRDVAVGDVLNIRNSNDWRAKKIGEIPHDGRCIKNLGCVGGLTLQEFTELPQSKRQNIAKQRPRWCRIDYQAQTGWVAARYLQESGQTCE